MKIEKLTENKIRIIANSSDLDISNFNNSNIFYDIFKNTDFFPSVLEVANKEVGFDTEGCKLLIEIISYFDGIFIFTITKCILDNNSVKLTKKINMDKIYAFKNFDEFCCFCEYLNTSYSSNIKKFCKNTSLYFYNNIYFLLINSVDASNKFFITFNFIISEFASSITSVSIVKSKLLEYGKLVIKNNAILTGIKYFSK